MTSTSWSGQSVNSTVYTKETIASTTYPVTNTYPYDSTGTYDGAEDSSYSAMYDGYSVSGTAWT